MSDRRLEMYNFTTMLENAGVMYVKTYSPVDNNYTVGVTEDGRVLLFKFDIDGVFYSIR